MKITGWFSVGECTSLTTVTTHEVPLLNYYFVLADSRFLECYTKFFRSLLVHMKCLRTRAFVCVFGAGVVLIHIEGISLHHMVLGDFLNNSSGDLSSQVV